METPRLDLIRLPSTFARSALVAGLAGVLLGAACGGSDGTGTAGSSGGGTTGGSAAGTSGGARHGRNRRGRQHRRRREQRGLGWQHHRRRGHGRIDGGHDWRRRFDGGHRWRRRLGGGHGRRGRRQRRTRRQRRWRRRARPARRARRRRRRRDGHRTAGSGGPATCPANATFCSGFETNALPTGAIYNGQRARPASWTRDFAIDTAQKNSGNSSLRVKSAAAKPARRAARTRCSRCRQRMNAFWVRFFVRSDMPMGGRAQRVRRRVHQRAGRTTA